MRLPQRTAAGHRALASEVTSQFEGGGFRPEVLRAGCPGWHRRLEAPASAGTAGRPAGWRRRLGAPACGRPSSPGGGRAGARNPRRWCCSTAMWGAAPGSFGAVWRRCWLGSRDMGWLRRAFRGLRPRCRPEAGAPRHRAHGWGHEVRGAERRGAGLETGVPNRCVSSVPRRGAPASAPVPSGSRRGRRPRAARGGRAPVPRRGLPRRPKQRPGLLPAVRYRPRVLRS